MRRFAFVLLLASASIVHGKEAVPPMFPSGDMDPSLRAQLPADTHYDSFGNAWVTRGSGSPRVLYVARRDLPGYVVSSITPEGYLRLQRIGTPLSPLFDQFMVGQRVLVYTSWGARAAVVGCPSTHFRRGADVPIPEATVDDLWVDIGAESDAEAHSMGIDLLDPVGLAMGSAAIAGGVTGPGAASHAILERLARMPGEASSGTRTFAIVAGGSEGGRGSRRLLATLPRPDSVYVLEAIPAQPSDSAQRAGSPVWPLRMAPGDTSVSARTRWADRMGGPIPPASLMSADSRVWSGAGIPTVFIGFPSLYAGTPIELTRGSHGNLDNPINLARESHADLDNSGPYPTWELHGSTPDSHAASMRVLHPLLKAYGVSEHETEVADAIVSTLPSDAAAAARLDERGNLILKLGEGRPDRLFVAHQDEIGYRVTAVDPDGRGRVRRIGGFFDWLYEGQLVAVHTGELPQVDQGMIVPHTSRRGRSLAVVPPRDGYRSGPRPAIANPLADAVHGPAPAGSRFDVNDVRIDPGLGAETSRPTIDDDITVVHEIARLGEHRVSARAIDDRYGCASLVMAAKELWPKRKQLPSTVWLVWSVEEEIGLNGATWLADSLLHHGMLPKRVHAVDTFVSSDSPLEDPRYGDAKLGKGAVVRAVDTSHEAPIEAVRATLKLAKEKDIPLQYGVTSGGNDGVPFAERGSINVPLAWPLRYSHSAVEVADLRDLESLARIITALSWEKATDDAGRP